MKARFAVGVVAITSLLTGQSPLSTVELAGFEPASSRTRWTLSVAKQDATSRTVRVVRSETTEPRAFAWRDVVIERAGTSIRPAGAGTETTRPEVEADHLTVVRWSRTTEKFVAVGHRTVSGRHDGAFGVWTHLVIVECRTDGQGRTRLAVGATDRSTIRAVLWPTDVQVGPDGKLLVVGCGLPFMRQFAETADAELRPFVVTSGAPDPNAVDAMARQGLLEFTGEPGDRGRGPSLARNAFAPPIVVRFADHDGSIRAFTLPEEDEPQTLYRARSPFGSGDVHDAVATPPMPAVIVGEDLVAAAAHELRLGGSRGTPKRHITIRIARLSPGENPPRHVDLPISTIAEATGEPVVHDMVVFELDDESPWALLLVTVGPRAYLVTCELPA